MKLCNMDVAKLRFYGAAFSDAEASWPKALKKKMVRTGRALIFSQLSFLQKIYFVLAFFREKRRARKLDLSDILAKGMTNKAFINQQLEYLAMFSALSQVLGTDKTIQVVKQIMDATAKEALLLCLPDPVEVQRLGKPLDVFREYFKVFPAANLKAGCHKMTIVEESENALQFDVSWCIWLELWHREHVAVTFALKNKPHEIELMSSIHFSCNIL